MTDYPNPPWSGPPPWPGTRGFAGPARDPDRIAILLEAVRGAWETSSDQRLGQLIVNAMRNAGIDVPPTPVFGIEDDRLLIALESLMEK